MTLTDALRAAARHVARYKAMMALEGEMPSDERRAEVIAAVSAFGHEIDSLAAADETAPVYLREFEAIGHELQAGEFRLAPEVAQAVASHAERLANAPPRRSKAAPMSEHRPRSSPAARSGRAALLPACRVPKWLQPQTSLSDHNSGFGSLRMQLKEDFGPVC